MKDKDLKKQKIDEAARRPGGRRKGQGEKYDPEASHRDTLKKSFYGRYSGTPFEGLYIAAERILGMSTEKHTKLEDAEMGLERFLLKLYKEKRWGDFLTLHSIFTELEERIKTAQTEGRAPHRASDQFRQWLLHVNDFLHAMRELDSHVVQRLRFVGKKKESKRLVITKAIILKEFKAQTGPDYSKMSDANLYKAMRSMGLPKKPEEEEMAAIIRTLEKTDAEWVEGSRPRPVALERYHLLREELEAVEKVSI